MSNTVVLSPEQFIERIHERLESAPRQSTYSQYQLAPEMIQPALYTLIVGAGFSVGVVPLVHELMNETIGDYFYPDQDMSSLTRPVNVRRRDSARFWKQFNAAALQADLPTVPLNRHGLPEDPGAAYRMLFSSRALGFMLGRPTHAPTGMLSKMIAARNAAQADMVEAAPDDNADRFLKGFLQYIMDPGAEHGYGSSGRTDLNPAHIYLGAILDAQQRGRGWRTHAFCRNIFTTNFDTLLQHALQLFNLPYLVTDRPARGFDPMDFPPEESAIHLIYTHGSILRYNPVNTAEDLAALATANSRILCDQLQPRDIITIGYSGWDDGLMAALNSCDSSRQNIYWCDIKPQPTGAVAEFLGSRGSTGFYVALGDNGADGLMHALYNSLVEADDQRDPMKRYERWSTLNRYA